MAVSVPSSLSVTSAIKIYVFVAGEEKQFISGRKHTN